ncbi:hypothetical protein GOV10_05505, partial [Candidatus Woesearchaeota archaeon]|nr:hypothetical protein [Candidatus Woesearchaeota archaeon]
HAADLKVDHILFHYPHEAGQTSEHLDLWESVDGNTDLPIFISGRINNDTVDKIISLKPNGIVIGSAITQAKDPAEAAKLFREIVK